MTGPSLEKKIEGYMKLAEKVLLRPKPTVAEIEAILASRKTDIDIRPDGSLVDRNTAVAEALRDACAELLQFMKVYEHDEELSAVNERLLLETARVAALRKAIKDFGPRCENPIHDSDGDGVWCTPTEMDCGECNECSLIGAIEATDPAAETLLRRLKAADAVCKSASSVVSEDRIREELCSFNMGIAMLHDLQLWRAEVEGK